MITVHMGDNLPWLQSLPDDSIDSLVTDPPYGLSKPPPIEVLLRAWLGGDEYEHGGGGFMGRKWDSMVPSPSQASSEFFGSAKDWESSNNETAPATQEAQQWDGFGTALKPCIEPFLLIRKPLAEKTIARQVLATGTGALNIDGCRYPFGDKAWPGPQDKRATLHSSATFGAGSDGNTQLYGKYGARKEGPGGDAKGGRFPSNYYHCPKASTKERERGCDSLPEVAGHDIVSRKEGSAGLDNPRAGAGRKAKSRKNTHNTIKPVRLMRWLCRLVTPPGGTVLEPFIGSGTTGVAASLEGFGCHSAEFTPAYHAIAEARIGHAIAHPDEWTDTTPGDWSHRAKSGGKP